MAANASSPQRKRVAEKVVVLGAVGFAAGGSYSKISSN